MVSLRAWVEALVLLVGFGAGGATGLAMVPGSRACRTDGCALVVGNLWPLHKSPNEKGVSNRLGCGTTVIVGMRGNGAADDGPGVGARAADWNRTGRVV